MYVVSKWLKGRGLGLQVSSKSFPTVYSRLRHYIDRGGNDFQLLHRPYFIYSQRLMCVVLQGLACVTPHIPVVVALCRAVMVAVLACPW